MEKRAHCFIASHRVARLATADTHSWPHVIPICYAFDGRHIFTALDLKPKRVPARRLKRLRNIEVNPRVALVIDDYSEDWSRLAYVLVTGVAAVVQDEAEQERAEAMLLDKYPLYAELLPSGAPILKITPEKVVSWGRV